jgi:hypothetical protein
VLPSLGTQQQQIADIGAGNQQDHAGSTEEDEDALSRSPTTASVSGVIVTV